MFESLFWEEEGHLHAAEANLDTDEKDLEGGEEEKGHLAELREQWLEEGWRRPLVLSRS